MNDKNLIMLSIDGKSITSDLDRAGYKKMGVDLRSTSTFKDAEAFISENTVDVIVINYDYEHVDAVQLCKHFKAQEQSKEIPIVFTSVQDKPRSIKAKDIGLDLFVEQPVPRQFFIEKIRNLLEQKTRGTDRVNITSEVTFELEGESVTCPIADLSKSGILLSTERQLKAETELDLTFSLPGYKKPIKVLGEVVRAINEQGNNPVQIGIGVRFKSFNGDSQKRLEKYISKSQDDDPKLAYYL